MAAYPVWGAQALVHVLRAANITMNGTMYQSLEKDLGKSAPFNDVDFKRALHSAGADLPGRTEVHTKQMVYVDHQNKAHWVYRISYFQLSPRKRPIKIVDTKSFKVYEQWNALHTFDMHLTLVTAEAYGGNERTGLYQYGVKYSKLSVFRNPFLQECYIENHSVVVEDIKRKNAVISFPCPLNPNYLFTVGYDKVNGAFCPEGDVLFNAGKVQELYMKWFGLNVLSNPEAVYPFFCKFN